MQTNTTDTVKGNQPAVYRASLKSYLRQSLAEGALEHKHKMPLLFLSLPLSLSLSLSLTFSLAFLLPPKPKHQIVEHVTRRSDTK